MRIHDLKILQVPFYYQTYEGEVEQTDEDGNFTGETTKVYSNPVKAYARISPNTGDTESSPFGSNVDYDRSISTVQDLPIDEYSRLFIDVVPELNEDGSTDTKPDFICVTVQKDLHRHVWAIKKIKAAIASE